MTKSETNWSETLEKALKEQEKGHTQEALALFEKCVPAIIRAIEINPQQAELHNNLGNVYKRLGKTHEAIKHYREALRLKSPYPEAHNNLGTVLYQIGQINEAIEHYQKALRMSPDNIHSHLSIATAYLQKNQLIDAIPHFENVLKQFPNHYTAIHNLGILYASIKNYPLAEPLLMKATEQDPYHIQALYHLALVQNGLGKLIDARKTYEKILTIDNQQANTHHNLATLLLHLNEKELALKHFQNALALDPQNVTAKHMINALTTQTCAEGAPTEYTRALFNQYAYNYDTHVKSSLHYQVPSLLRSLFSNYSFDMTKPLNALDLGCGTGLCAPIFSDIIARLTGVDISENMLLQAKEKGGYDKLIQDDMIHYLSQLKQQYDLIIAADVLVYFGELSSLFNLVKKSLTENGLFCFSTETLESKHENFQVQTTGRYAHTENYIKLLSKECQFTILKNENAILRYQENHPIKGDLWLLKNEIINKIN